MQFGNVLVSVNKEKRDGRNFSKSGNGIVNIPYFNDFQTALENGPFPSSE